MWYDQTIDGEYALIAPHTTFPLIAAATKDGRVDIFDDEGKKNEKADINKPSGGMILKWSLGRKLLGVGWGNGTVAVWCDHEKVLREGNVHQSAVTVMEWSPAGNRLVTGDEDGDVVVWKIDPRGRLSIQCQYRLSNRITHCVFRSSTSSVRESQVRATSSPPFFLATSTGSIHYSDDMGHCTESISTNVSVASLLMLEHKDVVVVITTELLLYQYSVTGDGKMTQESQMKLSTSTKSESKTVHSKWAGPSTLALSVGGQPIWMWDIENEENYVLNMDGMEKPRINCIAFSNQKNMLVAGTDSGHVVMWKGRFVHNGDEEKGRTQVWEVCSKHFHLKTENASPTLRGHQLINKTNTGGSVEDVSWGANSALLAVRKRTAFKILIEQVVRKRIWGRNAAVQVEQNKVVVYPGGKEPIERMVDLRIKGLALSRNHFAVWNGTVVEIQEYSDAGPALHPSHNSSSNPSIFPTQNLDWFLAAWKDATNPSDPSTVHHPLTIPADSDHIALDDSFIYICKGNRIDVWNHRGDTKAVLKWSESEGNVVGVESEVGALVCWTDRCFLKMFDTGTKDVRGVVNQLIDAELGLHSIICAKPNSNGSMISFTANVLFKGATQLRQSDSKIYVYDVDRDVTMMFDFSEYGCLPGDHYWDWEDSRILRCQGEKSGGNDDNDEGQEPQIFSFFVTPTHEITLHDIQPLPPTAQTLIGIYMPFHYYIRKPQTVDEDEGVRDLVLSIPARDFEGLENTDTTTMKAMVDFGFCLAVGDFDGGLKALKLIKSPHIWHTMAKMCVKTKRLDIAALCLANMGMGRAVGELEECIKKGESVEVCAAVVAVYLGMNEDAEELYISAGRYDLLNKFYQAINQWPKSLSTASTHDRIHLRTTYYNFAKHLESIGDISGAVAAYEKSGREVFEVPRMLMGRGEVRDLERFIGGVDSRELKKWWAQFAESTGDLDTALKYYELAGDTLSIVRMWCIAGDLDRATDIATKSTLPSTYHHLAHHHELNSNIPSAIHFYTLAHCTSHAIRLAKEHKLDAELMGLALQGSTKDMIDVGRYFENKGRELGEKAEAKVLMERAVGLYLRGGLVNRAVDLALGLGEEVVEDLVNTLPTNTPRETLTRLTQHFSNTNPTLSATLAIGSQNPTLALDIILQNNLPLPPSLADLEPTPETQPLILKMAEWAEENGDYHLACKKFMQVGERVRGMKALLRSGDTQRILVFANTSKTASIYILAANYLQTLPWRSNPTYTKSIITFYTKAKAWEQLASFYEGCAEGEVEEFQNYEKALQAYRTAHKTLSKLPSPPPQKLSLLESHITNIQTYLSATTSTDTLTTFQTLTTLLATPSINLSVRKGDIYAYMVTQSLQNGFVDQAKELVERMKADPEVGDVGFYLDARVLEGLGVRIGEGDGIEEVIEGE